MSGIFENKLNDFLLSFKEGEEEGFTYFFNLHYKPLFYFAGRYIKDNAAAEDIVADSFIKLWAKREIFDSESGLTGYLYRTVYHACLRSLQQEQYKNLHKKSYAGQINITEQDYINNIIKTETLHQLHGAIYKLPAQCRKVFVKLYIEGKSVSETAQEMNLTTSTIKNQKARGLKLLRPEFIP